MSDLERRIETLEKVNRRWRYAGVSLMGILLIALVSGGKSTDKVPDLLQARRIEVLGLDGKPRIVLEVNDKGSGLSLSARSVDQKEGNPAVVLEANDEKSELRVMARAKGQKDGKPVIALEAHDNRSALSVVAQGKGGQRAIGFGADKEGVGMMFMKHKEYPLLRFDGNDDGCMLAMFDGREPSQEPRGILLRTQRPTEGGHAGTVVALTRGSSKVDTRAGMFIMEPTETAENTYLQLSGSEGKTATVRVNQENGKLEVFGKGNKVMWTTP